MKITILGTGTVGRSVAGKTGELGHEVVIGTRDPEATLARSEPDQMGNPPFAAWHRDHAGVALMPFAEAAARGELIVNASNGAASLEVLRLAGTANLAGKVLVDIANPLDFSAGFPPTLLVKDTDSLAEQIQRAFPEARVVKALNTMNAGVMVDPGSVANGDHTVFVSGNHVDAKSTVIDLLRSFGWRDVIDLGDLSTARGTEMLLPIWVRLLGVLDTPAFNFRIAR
jgi:8-hydroxy-5-deazaflavin:NADPH oxidoreductase